jgi:hypothetical protein
MTAAIAPAYRPRMLSSVLETSGPGMQVHADTDLQVHPRLSETFSSALRNGEGIRQLLTELWQLAPRVRGHPRRLGPARSPACRRQSASDAGLWQSGNLLQ